MPNSRPARGRSGKTARGRGRMSTTSWLAHDAHIATSQQPGNTEAQSAQAWPSGADEDEPDRGGASPCPRQSPAPSSAGQPPPPYALPTTGIPPMRLCSARTHPRRTTPAGASLAVVPSCRPNQRLLPRLSPLIREERHAGPRGPRTCCPPRPRQRCPSPSIRNVVADFRIPTVSVQLARIDVNDCLQRRSTSSRLKRCTRASRPRSPHESAKLPEWRR
ncbi:hypothetical protein BD626DRAFT_507495 [Schizophyllum amplum]|uniref:Uncharacterized protein n=1 Tax=Schizophyllum amplum TaxID=97359 RepID=A0A550C418_9AGAR|nr:hypothetical protein BD626DRAFT_507495 [Auriculariopsis ampla]